MANGEFGLGRFPVTRMRRNRRDDWNRRLVAENVLTPADFIWPVFVHDSPTPGEDIASLPGIQRHSIDALVDEVGRAKELGIPLIAIFPAVDPALKNETGDEAVNPENLVCRAVRAVKDAHSDIGVMCDVALDPFTSHGHDGLLRDGQILNDETIEVLVRQALVQAEAGCDVIAPSDMMDGRVAAIRTGLDKAGYFLDGTREGLELIDSVDRPEVQLLFDLYHSEVMGEVAEEVLAGRVGLLAHVHLADAPGRQEPGTGALPWRERLTWLAAQGYRGRIGLEYRPSGATVASLGWLGSSDGAAATGG